ncbi:hypothetical protein ACFX12_030838 [Malus domestica]
MPSPNLVLVLGTEIYALKNAIRLITEDDLRLAPEGNYVDEVRQLSQDWQLALHAISKKANGVAHLVARFGLHEQGFGFWTDVGPHGLWSY